LTCNNSLYSCIISLISKQTKPVELVGAYLDYRSYFSNLIWANRRSVEPEFLKGSTSSANDAMCWLIEAGSVRVTAAHQALDVHQGQWVFLSSASTIQEFEPGTRIVSLRFRLSHLEGHPIFKRQRHRVFESARYPDLETTADRLVREFTPWQSKDSLVLSYCNIPLQNHFTIEAAFNQWLAAYSDVMQRLGATYEAHHRLDRRVEFALLYIERYPFSKKFSEKVLAEHVGISVNQMLLLFRQETGSSPYSFYEKRRQEFARRTLIETPMPIKELSFNLGFGSASHFSNWFTKKEGMSPRAYRNQQTISDLS
jgi:AraC-like DNA-binding protein